LRFALTPIDVDDRYLSPRFDARDRVRSISTQSAAKSDERVVTHRRRLRNPLDVARRRVARAPDRVDGSRAMLAASRTSRVGVAPRARVARGV
jgi:hypothetical protein